MFERQILRKISDPVRKGGKYLKINAEMDFLNKGADIVRIIKLRGSDG